jgi:hypothetical protein
MEGMLSDAMVVLLTSLARAMRIFTMKIDQWLIPSEASVEVLGEDLLECTFVAIFAIG